ncbi:hypothetical protein RHMOL_Rhmol08G0190200 [Rhododendron molle]|uniref:Uncharacterized protein n=1 Tax=Rhododendron molle TaxID=49168 RepID=A0ACC0MR34_RHOML|nr:hypothetical protein RHMOL_Rhmol08G0190200 [Rhododendron molle]
MYTSEKQERPSMCLLTSQKFGFFLNPIKNQAVNKINLNKKSSAASLCHVDMVHMFSVFQGLRYECMTKVSIFLDTSSTLKDGETTREKMVTSGDGDEMSKITLGDVCGVESGK